MIAVSEPGRGASHSASRNKAVSSLIGLILTKVTPAPLAARSPFRLMCSPSPPTVICVLQRQPAEHHDQVGIVCDAGPVSARSVDRLHATKHAAGDDGACGITVRIHRVSEPTDQVQEAPDLGLGVVEAARTRPAIGTTIDGFVAALRNDTFQLARDEVERLVPFDLDVAIAAATFRICTRPIFDPAPAYGRPQHTAAMMERRGDRAE